MQFQYYEARVNSTRALGCLKLETFIEKTKNPKDDVKGKFELLKTAEGEEKDNLKKSLYYFTPSVLVSDKRVYTDIVRFTGLLVLDFDKIPNAERFKQYLFETYKFVITAYTSPSRRGVKAICKIPIVNSVDEYKSIFYAMADIMDEYEGFDMSNQNPVLPLFGSYDSNILYRTDYIEFNRKGIKLNEYDHKTIVEPKEVVITSDDTEYVKEMLEKMITKINSDGHPQVRSASLVAGGYVSAGYITEFDAETILKYNIQVNSYLKKSTSTYISTMKRFLKEGQRRPIYREKKTSRYA